MKPKAEGLLQESFMTPEIIINRSGDFPHVQQGFMPLTVYLIGRASYCFTKLYQQSNKWILCVLNCDILER